MESQKRVNRKKSYAEILEILKYVDKAYVDKIPKKLIDFFKENKAMDYDFKYDSTLEISKQKLHKSTIVLLAMLNLNYWCDSEEHKKELIKKYNENEQKYQEQLREKYNPDNILKKRKQKKGAEEKIAKEDVAMIEYKESILKKVINKLKSIFNIG